MLSCVRRNGCARFEEHTPTRETFPVKSETYPAVPSKVFAVPALIAYCVRVINNTTAAQECMWTCDVMTPLDHLFFQPPLDNFFLRFFYFPRLDGVLRFKVNKWTPPRNSGGILSVSTIFSQSMEMGRLTRDGTAEPVSQDQILRRGREQGNIHFPCSADHVHDWQPNPVGPYSSYRSDHTNIHTYIHT